MSQVQRPGRADQPTGHLTYHPILGLVNLVVWNLVGGHAVADVYSQAERSKLMAKVRSKGNKDTELKLMAIFRAHGITGWRRHRPVFGHPDFVFPREKIALFVDGCFWHGCPAHYRAPAQNAEFWVNKLQRNRGRDRLVTRTLTKRGWKVVRIWEHSLKHGNAVAARMAKTLDARRKASCIRPFTPLSASG
jgi:DNA mismatch endonuclease, patch repair protein